MDNHAQIRANLNKLKQKLSSSTGKIAYMGSSVTVQKEGYRIFLQQFIREYFNREHLEISAAIGGVGAITGVFAMDEDVIDCAPDLCLIEYMVSDRIEANTPQSEIGKVIEGIVRKLNRIDCSIVFVYRYIERDLINNRYQYALNEYEKVAQHYNITSIDFGGYIQECLDRHKHAHQTLFKDHTHTTVEGSQVAANYIAGVLKSIFESGCNLAEQKQNFNPIYSDNYEDTIVTYVNDNFLKNQDNYLKGSCADKVKNHQSKNKDYQYIEIADNNSFQFKIKGELIGLMVIVGRDSGVVELSADEEIERVMLWDKWCHYDRFSTIVLLKKYDTPTAIKIRITNEAIDYSSCRRKIDNPEQIVKKIKLVGFMTRANTEITTVNSAIKTSIDRRDILPQKNSTISKLIESAKVYESEKKYDEALSLYFQAAKVAANKRVGVAIAKHLIKRERKQKAELDILFAKQKNPAFYVNLAQGFYGLEKFEKSIACFRKAIELNPRLAEDVLPIIQVANLRQNKQEQAVKLYKEWIENYYIINHQCKIIYCPIPKNACTLFKEVIVTNSEHKSDFQQSGLDVHRYIRQNNVKLADFSYLSNPEYLNIAIVRNPFDRLVSGYLNKFVRPKKASNIVRSVIKDIYLFDKVKPDYQKSITFSDFINYLARTEDYFLNEHWRSQHFFLGMGLVEFDLFDSLENASNIIQKLELRIGTEISQKKTKNQTNYGEDIVNQDWHAMYPPQLREFDRLPTARLLYTPELTTTVKSRFASDIKIFDNL